MSQQASDDSMKEPSRRPPNQREIARLTGVSAATVSRVLSNNPHVDPKTRELVKSAAKNMGYLPNVLAKSLRTLRSGSIGLVIPDISNPFFSEVLHGMESVCNEAGYHIILGNTNESVESERRVVRHLAEKRVDGFIMILVDPSGAAIRQTLGPNPRVPIVLLDRCIEDSRYDVVTIDNAGGMAKATQYLLELGHTRIALIHPPRTITPGSERRDGYLEALRAANCPVDEGLIREGSSRIQDGYEQTKLLLQLKPRPTAVIGGNNLMAIGAFEAIRDMELRIPEDISLIGFDDFLLANYLSPPVTVVQRATADMGFVAAKALISRIQGHDHTVPRKMVLPTTLCVRESCTWVPR